MQQFRRLPKGGERGGNNSDGTERWGGATIPTVPKGGRGGNNSDGTRGGGREQKIRRYRRGRADGNVMVVPLNVVNDKKVYYFIM